MQAPKIVVVIPTYNCERQISRVLKGFDNRLLAEVEKVIVIDNASHDRTAIVASQTAKKLASKKFEVWQNTVNYGLGGTHKVAFLAAEKMGVDYVAVLHGDDQAKTEELLELIEVAKAHPEFSAILGSRFMRNSKLSGYSRKRVFGNRVINCLYSVLTMRMCRDLGSGLNLFRLRDLSDHRYLGFDDGITFNIDLLLDYFKKKSPLTFIPISWREEDQISNARNLAVGLIAIKKLLRWRINREPFHAQIANRYTSKPLRLSHERNMPDNEF